ncbi:hypothetical protein EVAR_41223_1 [Eumeta japonica]|uniref:Uncharacterized protein n=1 Tax=Eumeta variegata TaxID=151549 RepID=A0A4C1W5V4_EUMVA|nr:hypothetical protein EVAR_41223_1 [Eumeta japonica]
MLPPRTYKYIHTLAEPRLANGAGPAATSFVKRARVTFDRPTAARAGGGRRAYESLHSFAYKFIRMFHVVLSDHFFSDVH